MHKRLLQLVFYVASFLSCLSAEVTEGFLETHADRLDGLIEALDPDHPEMKKVKHLWMTGERLAATNSLAEWFRNKPFPVELLQPLDFPDDLETHARAALGDSFFLLSEWETVAKREDGGIDWLDRGSSNDKERAWMLNRHGVFPDLAEAWERTGDARYREQINDLWQDWILANPYPDRITFSPPWRALEVARRILNAWVHVYYGYDVLTDETRILVLTSIINHADALKEHASFWGGNHLISEKLALLTLAAAWPEFSDARTWRDHAIESVTREFEKQTYPDGNYRELSNHYQRVVLVNAQYFLSVLSMFDEGYRDLPIVEQIETMWDLFARTMRPDGSGPLNNASDLEANDAFVRDVYPFFNREDWAYIASGGGAGRQPEVPPSALFPWGGQAILRNTWDGDAHWVYFDGGPYGSAHQHVDRLHVSASLKGKPWLVDSGRYTYQPGKWLDYFKGPASHNTLVVNGKAATQGPRIVDQPMPVAFQSGKGFAFAGASSFFKLGRLGITPSIPWTRAVLLDDRGFVLVADHLVTFKKIELTARWHFHPDINEEEAASGLRLLHPPEGFTQTLFRGQEEPEVAGFYSPEYNLRLPACEMLTSGQLDRPTTLIWVLQSPDGAPIEMEILSDPGAPLVELLLIRQGSTLARASIRLYPEVELIEYVVEPTP